MSLLATLLLGAILGAPPVATLHRGQTRWFVPGELRAGDEIACGGTAVLVPAAQAGVTSGSDQWGGGGLQVSIETRPNGAAEVDCGKGSVPRRTVSPRYVVSRNGLGLTRGANTLAQVRKLYGPGTANARGGICRVAWRALGLTATFAGCGGGSVLTGATVTGRQWSSLDGVHVGESIARMRWDDQGATRRSGRTWLLGGVGRKHPPRLLAVIGTNGRVAALVAVTR